MNSLSLAQANQLIAAALHKARELELPPMSVAVLDAGGHLIALQREDGQAFLRVRICQAKAWGALALHTPSHKLAERVERGGRDAAFIEALNDMSGGQLIPLPGGLLIHNHDGAIIGAVGVAGGPSEQDQACAIAGIEAIGLQARLD
jgi:uncharacterized protein GlcG (DUF336 family)